MPIRILGSATRPVVAGLFLISALMMGPSTPSFANPNFSFEPPKGWQLTPSQGADKLWLAKDQANASFSVVTSTSDDDFDFRNPKILIAMIEQMRRMITQSFGIKDWTIDSHELKELSGNRGHVLRLKGHYTGARGQRVSFVEWQYYVGRQYLQATYTQEKATRSQTEIENILRGFKPEGLKPEDLGGGTR